MSQDWADSKFEGFRRNRKRRKLEAGPQRNLGRRAGVLRELEATEAKEMANERMSREVHEFFSDATRTAAEIVARVTEEVECEHSEHITTDMIEFLHDAVNRAQEMILQLRGRDDISTIGVAEMEANIHNIVGATLDAFRDEGTAQLDDKHIGQDPFATDADLSVDAEPEVSGDALEIEEHLVADVVEQPAKAQPEIEVPAFLMRLAGDQEKLIAALKSLVATGAMTKEEALAMFHAVKAS